MTNSIAKDFRFFSLLRFAFPTMIMMVFMSLYTINVINLTRIQILCLNSFFLPVTKFF